MREGCGVVLLEARGGEGAWDVVSCCWVGGVWWLVWVQRAAVVAWCSEAVSWFVS